MSGGRGEGGRGFKERREREGVGRVRVGVRSLRIFKSMFIVS